MSFLSRVEGDDEFQRELRVVAAKNGVAASSLIRTALETAYKADFEKVRSFFQPTAYKNTQSNKARRKPKGGK